MADLNTAFMQQIFDISKRKWKTDIHHHRQADDFRRRFEIMKWAALYHPQTLNSRPALLKLVSSDRPPLYIYGGPLGASLGSAFD